MHALKTHGHLLGGTLLISGTMIGVGMLAMPVATGPSGFVPSIFVYLVTWVFMLCTGLLLLEACTWMPKGANFITLTEKLLGPTGKVLCWVVYLFLFITVLIAHIVGGGAIVREIIGDNLSLVVTTLLYVLVFSPVIYLGAKAVDRLNIVVVIGVVITYFLFIGLSVSEIRWEFLKFMDWSKVLFTFPVLFTAFTYQLIIPTLMDYMHHNVRRVRLAIIVGSIIPLFIYIVFEALILGIVPVDGDTGLQAAASLGQNAITPLQYFVSSPKVFSVGKAFAFFALTVSYVPISLAYLDFLSDGLKVKSKGVKRAILCLCIFIPPTLIAILNPKIFLVALSYTGGISCATLFGLFPPLMVWQGRYRKKYPRSNRQIPGGKRFLGFLIILAAGELIVELVEQILRFT